ncbi:MAG: SdrD B-like domain-containing protein, partial [Saprospiraceae bacterium]
VSDATFAQVSTTTDASGKYKFDNLKPGTYNIVFGQVTLKNLTNPKVGADDGKDSDPVLGGQVSNVTLVSGVPRGDIDAGYVPISTASISGFVWEDLNANGVQDDGESGISNDTVSLKREDGNFSGVIVTVITNQNGRYIFSNLAAGSYSVIFSRPSGFEFTDYDMGDDVKDSDVLPPLGKTSVFTIGFGQSLLNIDAGLFRRGTLGDFVWNDSNGNGLQEGSEPGLSGIMLTLKDETNSDIGSTISDINGKYLFSNIKPAKYRIEAVLPKGYTSVPINPLDLSINSDFSPSDSLASTALITVLSGIQNLDIDLGIVIKSRISGIAWKDSNGNGLREEIEPMMDSVIVILLNSTGSELKIDTTDSNGAYLFKDIDAGTYKVKFANMPGMFFTYPNVGSNDSKSSDVIDQSGVTSEFLLMEGLDMANVCVGYVNSSSIGDYIWIDENKNGLQSSDEVGLNGVKIYLLNQSGIVIDSTTSNINNSGSGYYSFSNLIYGQYSVKFSLPQNFDFTILNSSDTLLNSDIVDASTGKTRTITLLPGQMRNDIDAGYTLKAAIAGTINGIVWQDSNNNKFRDGDDSLLSGITVSLFKIDRTLVGTTLSGPDGSYSFSQVAFGDYFVSVPLINDKMFVLKQGNPVPNGSQISNNFGAGSTDLISVLPGNTVSGIDMGYFRKITIGDFVWDDLNNNGLQDTNEPGIGNITISLINEAGLTEKTTTSDNSGQYIISDIGPGRYKVKFSLKPDYVFAKLNSTNDNKNSKVSPINGETPLLDFLTLITYANIDAGYTKAGSVGSRVWLDLNGNGVFQTNEPGIPDIKVKLYSEDGSLADSTITGQDGTSLFSGFYTFSKVRPGKYYIKFEIPANFIISVADVGGDDDVDSDITGMFGSMTTDLFEVSGNQFVKNIDAGVYRPATIGDRVWNDLNMNGIQEFGEPGLANVKVSLHNQSGILLDTTRTNGQGIYSFMNLRQRLYYLQFSLPEGFQFTIQNAPGSNEDDSDVDNAGTTPLISLAHGSNLLQIDAGIFRSSARIVMGKVWNDTNEDGICNTGETYETGVKVYLKDLVTGEVKSSITNHAGRYALITNNVGEHHVVVEAPDDFVFTEKGMGNDYESDSDVNELGISDVLMLTDQYIMKYIDAGYYYKVVSSLNGKVWKDKNHNGLRDDTDSLMQNVVVFLFDKSRIFVKSTKTNSVGEYSFKFLDAGQYYCRIPEFSDMSFVMFTGNNQEKDSEITNQFGVGTSRLITINPGIPLNNFDFGYVDLNRLVVSDPKRIVQYEVFPNPVINEIRVKVPSDILMKTQYNIINNMGRVVKSGTIDGESEILVTGHLPSGRYVIQFYNEKERILKTFIKVDN